MLSATAFNQDLSGWCVSNITSQPNSFAEGSDLTESNRPVWGTCPDNSHDSGGSSGHDSGGSSGQDTTDNSNGSGASSGSGTSGSEGSVYYSNGEIVSIDPIVFYDRELVINGIKLIVAGDIGGQASCARFLDI